MFDTCLLSSIPVTRNPFEKRACRPCPCINLTLLAAVVSPGRPISFGVRPISFGRISYGDISCRVEQSGYSALVRTSQHSKPARSLAPRSCTLGPGSNSHHSCTLGPGSKVEVILNGGTGSVPPASLPSNAWLTACLLNSIVSPSSSSYLESHL